MSFSDEAKSEGRCVFDRALVVFVHVETHRCSQASRASGYEATLPVPRKPSSSPFRLADRSSSQGRRLERERTLVPTSAIGRYPEGDSLSPVAENLGSRLQIRGVWNPAGPSTNDRRSKIVAAVATAACAVSTVLVIAQMRLCDRRATAPRLPRVSGMSRHSVVRHTPQGQALKCLFRQVFQACFRLRWYFAFA
jgi:hypothetical protein